jgi:hypothetical protein
MFPNAIHILTLFVRISSLHHRIINIVPHPPPLIMKLSLALFLSAIVGVTAAKEVAPLRASISASSEFGQRILSEARKLEENNDDAVDYTWVANMSLKYQGCYHTQVWNDEANGDNDVRVSTQRLVRFRLCPSDSCMSDNPAGCKSGYGDYVIGMETYLASYLDIVQRDHEYSCQVEANTGDVASCEDDYCKYDTYMAKGMEYCVENNPYEQGNDNNKNDQNNAEWFNQIAQGCQQWKYENNYNNRKLEDNQVAYYMGAFCSENGGSIHIGLFTEETCSTPWDENNGADTYLGLTGTELPYATTTLIGSECVSCMEPKDQDQNNQNDQYDVDQVKESCESLYFSAGKCETGMSITAPDTGACNFMEGIKIYRKNGELIYSKAKAGTTASVFVGLFATAFILTGGYAYYLKSKLDRSKVALSE